MYLGFGHEHVPDAQPETRLGLRRADGGKHRYFEVGIEHLAFTVDSRSEVDDASSSIPMGFGSRSITGPIRCASSGTRG